MYLVVSKTDRDRPRWLTSDVEQVSQPTPKDPAGVWGAKSWTVVVTTTAPTPVQPYVVCANVG